MGEVLAFDFAAICCTVAADVSVLAVGAVPDACLASWCSTCCALLQHVHTQAEATQEMEELISLDTNAMARRTNVRTCL